MQWFYDLKIGKKLILSFAILTIFTCALGLFSIAQIADNAVVSIAGYQN